MNNNMYDIKNKIVDLHESRRDLVDSLCTVFRDITNSFDIEESLPEVSKNHGIYVRYDSKDGVLSIQVSSWEENRDWVRVGVINIDTEAGGFPITSIDTWHKNDREYVDAMYDLADYIKEQVRFHWKQRAVK